jgi:molybdopterin-binding protein
VDSCAAKLSDDLSLAIGDEAIAVIKASDLMVAK